MNTLDYTHELWLMCPTEIQQSELSKFISFLQENDDKWGLLGAFTAPRSVVIWLDDNEQRPLGWMGMTMRYILSKSSGYDVTKTESFHKGNPPYKSEIFPIGYRLIDHFDARVYKEGLANEYRD